LSESRATALGRLKSFNYLQKAPAAGVGDVDEFLNLPNHMRRAEGRPFPLPSIGWVPGLPPCDPQTCAKALHSMMACKRFMAAMSAAIWARTVRSNVWKDASNPLLL
jgi:hypothetical protein